MSDYDMSIHSNPDAAAWARFFMETAQKNGWRIEGPDEATMLGWFANAMCAALDARAAPPAPRETCDDHRPDGPDPHPNCRCVEIDRLCSAAAAPPRESGGRLCARCKLGREGDPLNADFHCSTCYREMEMRARESGGGGFDKRAADALAREVQKLIDRKVIDSRSMAADALLDYVDPGPNESVPGKLAESGGGTGDGREAGFREGVARSLRIVNAMKQRNALAKDRAAVAGRENAASHRQSDIETCEQIEEQIRSLSPSPRQPTGEDRRERVVEAARVLDASARKHEEHGQNFPAFWIRDELDALRAALRSLSPAGDTNTSSPETGPENGGK